MRSTIVRVIAGLCLCLAALALAACSDDGGDGLASEPDPDRYCELVAELEKSGREAFAAVDANETATEEDYIAASQEFAKASTDKFDELIAVAPTEIRADVETLIATVKGQSDLGPEVPDEESKPADNRITAWEEENC